jgi:ATP-binding cassette subfamily B (MDR/TAP) protein 1
VAQLSITFIVLAAIGGVACYVETCFWMASGNRLTNRLRRKYLAVLLEQEIGFFDTQATTGTIMQCYLFVRLPEFL